MKKRRKLVFNSIKTESSWHDDDLVTVIKSEQRQLLFNCEFRYDLDLTPSAL